MNRVLKRREISLNGAVVALYTLFLIKLMTGSIIPINLYMISLIVLSFSLIHYLFEIHTHKVTLEGRLILFWSFMLYCIISLIWTRDLQYGTQKLFILLSIVIISNFISRLTLKKTKIFINLFTFGSFLILIWYLSTNGFKKIDLSSQYFRLDLKEELNPIVIARYFCFAILTLLFYLRFHKKNRIIKFFVVGIIGLLIILVFLTGSKGPVIALILSIILPYIIAKRFRFKAKSFFFGITGLLLLIYLLLFIQDSGPSALSSFIERRYWGTGASASLSGREVYLNIAFDHIVNQPIIRLLLGNGMGDFGYVYPASFQANYPHNIFVELLYEIGLLGFFIFVVLIYKVVRINFKSGKQIFYRRYESKALYYFLSLFYFSFLASMTSGDIAGNFFVFVSILFIYQADKLMNTQLLLKQKNKGLQLNYRV